MSADNVGCYEQGQRGWGYEHQGGRGRAAAKHPITLRKMQGIN